MSDRPSRPLSGRGRLDILVRRGTLAVLPLAGFFGWQLVIWCASPEPWLLPSPWAVADVVWQDHARLWFHAQATIASAAAGFALAAVLGTIIALALANSRMLERAVHPWLVASQAVPVLALAPLLAVWLSYGAAQVMVAFIVSFFPVVVTGIAGLNGVDPALGGTLRTLGARPHHVFLRVTVPAALPTLFSGLKLAAVFSVTGAVVGEYVGANRGLGYLTEFSTAQFRTDRSFAAVFLLGVIGVVFFSLVAVIERLTLPHQRHASRPVWRTQ